MAFGFCPALLTSIEEIAGTNAPSRKMHIVGALAALFCCQNSTVSPVNSQFSNGHQRTLTVKYRQRPTLDSVQDEDNCDVNRIPAYAEWNIPDLGFKSTSFYLDDETMSKYCQEASARRSAGTTPPTTLMNEIYLLVLEHVNILMKAINQDVVTSLATEFGVNVTTGSSTGKVINISRDGDKYILDNGVIDLMRDIQENEICGEPCIVGNGLWAAYDIARAISCCNAAGLDLSRLGLPRFFPDKDTQTIWGENTIGLLAPGSVKFIGRNSYVGAFAGQRGNSFFGTLPMPVNEFGCNLDDCLRDLVFDIQVRYIDCPTVVMVNDVETTVDRGWQVIISKRYAVWTQPETAYAAGDDLFGTNGLLKYFVTNTTSDAGSYAYPA